MNPKPLDRVSFDSAELTGAQRRCTVDTMPNPGVGRPHGLYGNAFARASVEQVLAASSAAHRLMAREAQAAESRRKAQISSLTEEIRQLLAQAAYVELARAAVRDMFDDEDLPLDFSDQAYERLKRHKYPFAGALKQVAGGLPRPRPEDSFYLKMKASKRDVLTRRFDAIRGRLGERLHQLVAAKQAGEPGGTAGMPSAPSVECFSACRRSADSISRGGGHGTH